MTPFSCSINLFFSLGGLFSLKLNMFLCVSFGFNLIFEAAEIKAGTTSI